MSFPDSDSTRRFSNRAAYYVNHRPYYPEAIVATLVQEAGLAPVSIVTDIGSGTGNLSLLFLKNGNRVLGIEPNDAMRLAGEKALAGYPGFVSIKGTAEATTLADHSVDLIAAGQAFHWFDPAAARREFKRILKPGGPIALIWNDWGRSPAPFNEAYGRLFQDYGLNFAKLRHRRASGAEMISQFFAEGRFGEHHYDNYQSLDFEGLLGRLLSSSYSPTPGHPDYEPMVADLRHLFETYGSDGKVRLEYDTVMYAGYLDS